ncbi:hypothetical protein NDI37_24290 [Funiculus sociatus GB2-A5]|uniref:HNH endonuclease n=1 Tax=Funiculus sociatus GB2-A5 TaxID=2933946 RepID=A0ABV0JVZ4_9CYAN|nr:MULTISPECIES: hypothetical protein [unclassified Trichocoleus]MBD1906334.1 hypothetical protein [Trichocoleus sp. FACHB-832]MBD2062830.1 hypothetical protein [Trichocoleus sp. FACHB-6]
MRWVDIHRLDFPPEWHERANKALFELRQEIEQAELAAQSSGGNVKAARKKAITEGLKKKARQDIWRDLSSYLARLRKGKCWYSESKNSGSDMDVDHFRPKNAVKEEPNHEGYWWLAFNWENYRYSCQWCNQRRVDVINETDGGKWDYFPVALGSFRARQEGDNCDDEEVNLLDPINPHDCKLLTFRPDGQPIPTKPSGTREFERAKTSIWLYHLDRKEFVDDRRIVAGRVQRLVQYMETLHPQIVNPKMRKLYNDQVMELLRLIDRDSEYSAAAVAYAKAEIYKMERGHQVKRQWLEDILINP